MLWVDSTHVLPLVRTRKSEKKNVSSHSPCTPFDGVSALRVFALLPAFLACALRGNCCVAPARRRNAPSAAQQTDREERGQEEQREQRSNAILAAPLCACTIIQLRGWKRMQAIDCMQRMPSLRTAACGEWRRQTAAASLLRVDNASCILRRHAHTRAICASSTDLPSHSHAACEARHSSPLSLSLSLSRRCSSPFSVCPRRLAVPRANPCRLLPHLPHTHSHHHVGI